jgi:hypothetical protein
MQISLAIEFIGSANGDLGSVQMRRREERIKAFIHPKAWPICRSDFRQFEQWPQRLVKYARGRRPARHPLTRVFKPIPSLRRLIAATIGRKQAA